MITKTLNPRKEDVEDEDAVNKSGTMMKASWIQDKCKSKFRWCIKQLKPLNFSSSDSDFLILYLLSL